MKRITKKGFYLLLSLLPFQVIAQCPTLVWADEFETETLDTSDWNYQLGDGCDLGICDWGNNEKQFYQQGNVSLNNGILSITARIEPTGGKTYTSARINTKGKIDQTYGRFEARIKLPKGAGTWPAFWMLPTDEVYGGWPQSGEIDIMEYIGHEPEEVLGTIHYGNPWPNNQFQGNDYKLASGHFYDDFHEFAVEWEDGEIRWFMDNILYSTKTKADVAPSRWPFDQDFHILLNLALGGNLGGIIDNFAFPLAMEVDYVRVYDGNRPYLSGKQQVANAASGQVYSIGNVAPSTMVNWTVPEGATIVSGQGTPTLTIDWGNTGGSLQATVTTDCEVLSMAMPVEVEPPFAPAFSFENFDQTALATLGNTSGMHSEVDNPAPNAVNGSARSGRYVRNGQEQFDVIFYDVSNLIANANSYVDGSNKFYIDLYTEAAIGTEIILQMESASATPNNYPLGRHSRFSAKIAENNNWHRLEFQFLDQPDASTSPSSIKNIILLFASNTFSNDTYHYDNFDSYSSQTTDTKFVESDQFSALAFPNPSQNQFGIKLDLEHSGQVQIEAYSVDGRLVSQKQFGFLAKGKHVVSIPAQTWAPGTYLLKINLEGGLRMLQLVKE